MPIFENPLQILVVDDTAIYRKIITEVLAEIPGVEVVGTANNGRDALEKIIFYQPDLLTLDLEMPEMDGLEVLEQLQTKAPNLGAVVISSHTVEGGESTIKALNRGAFDFILKPENVNVNDNKQFIRQQLELILEAFRYCRRSKKSNVRECRETYREALTGHRQKKSQDVTSGRNVEIVAIGVSTGGPKALAEILPMFAADFPVPIVIAQHMPSGFTSQLADSLNRKCALQVREAAHMDLLSPGTVFVAPGGRQMKINSGPAGIKHIMITDEETGSVYKPSIDLLFRSVAENFGASATGVVMTGMGSDGLQGLKNMKRKGATIIAQDEESCVIYGMPASAVKAGIVDMIVSLSELAAAITGTLKSRERK